MLYHVQKQFTLYMSNHKIEFRILYHVHKPTMLCTCITSSLFISPFSFIFLDVLRWGRSSLPTCINNTDRYTNTYIFLISNASTKIKQPKKKKTKLKNPLHLYLFRILYHKQSTNIQCWRHSAHWFPFPRVSQYGCNSILASISMTSHK